MSRLYHSFEIVNNHKDAKKILDFASEWTKRTACGKLVLSKDEVDAVLGFCASLMLSADANLDAFEKTAEKNGVEEKENPVKEPRPANLYMMNEAEEQAWQTMADSRHPSGQDSGKNCFAGLTGESV